MSMAFGIAAWIAVMALLPEPVSVAQESIDATELSRLEAVWNEAHLQGNANALDSLWADDLIVTVPKMMVLTKAEAIGIMRSGRMTFTHYHTSDLRIRVYGDAAVVTGRLQRTRHRDGREVGDDWRFTKVYIRRANSWRVVAWHASESAP